MDIEVLGFQCGGRKGIAYVGALTQLQKYGMNMETIKCFVGTGEGAEIAALLAFGYTITELEGILEKYYLSKKSISKWALFIKSYRIMKKYGYSSGTETMHYIDSLFLEKSGNHNTTFLELYKKRKVHLCITGTCLSTGELAYFDYMKTPYMSVSTAVHISCTKPFYNDAIIYDNQYWVNGSILCDIPMDIFKSKNTLFLEIHEPKSDNDVEIKNILQFAYSIVNTTNVYCNRNRDSNKKVKIIQIECPEVSYKPKKIKTLTKLHLIQQGKHSVSYYMQQHMIKKLIMNQSKSVSNEESPLPKDEVPPKEQRKLSINGKVMNVMLIYSIYKICKNIKSIFGKSNKTPIFIQHVLAEMSKPHFPYYV